MYSPNLLKGKKPFKVTRELRERVVDILRDNLSRDERVLLAILFGGFLEYEYTRDIDIAIYLVDPRDILDDYMYVEELSEKMKERIGYPIDFVILNHLENDYLFNTILLKGIPVVVKDYKLYYGLRMLAYDQRFFFRRYHGLM